MLLDNDKAGYERLNKIGPQLLLVVKSLKYLTFPDTGPGGDVTDWLQA